MLVSWMTVTLFQSNGEEITANAHCFSNGSTRRAVVEVRFGAQAVSLCCDDIVQLNELSDRIAAAVEWATNEEDERAANAGEVVTVHGK